MTTRPFRGALLFPMFIAALGTAEIGCAHQGAPSPPRLSRGGWSPYPRPILGLGCQLPDDWTLDETEAASVARPKVEDDALVLFAKVDPRAAQSPADAVGELLPLRDVRYTSRDQAADGLAGGRVSEGSATLEPSIAVTFRLYEVSTAAGSVVVTTVVKTTAKDSEQKTVQHIASSLRVVEAPKKGKGK